MTPKEMKKQIALRVLNSVKPVKEDGRSYLLEMGQDQLIESEALPVKMGKNETVEDYQKMGIVMGEPFEDDPLFRRAKLPDGWKKEPVSSLFPGTDSSPVWTYVIDEKGRLRIFVFYKAAFYDRRAYMRCAARFLVDDQDYFLTGRANIQLATTDKERGRDIVVLDNFYMPSREIYREKLEYHEEEDYYKNPFMGKRRKARDKAEEWLRGKYPNFKDNNSYYWDEE
jgi:hypothetical protein